ncbi:MAG: hypothetical protein A2289_00270 [Deltaproteobacteria bacterium RIFOXYA12_FULL_58_15]|nr:MAG: hypothetical protein A2289_00270 [Deltaproteobacteria bacterium RIFOXYA12_FULL_58_15]OGR11720.1 MAG: hypothetical protein A2341_09370 [Deltaproteobacteria bacterium RIFOXYB12_FULL_58_9]
MQRNHLSPEEHEAAYGDRADHRVKIWRETFGPGKRPSGARFRDEVLVCVRCGNVASTHMAPGPRCFGTTGRKVRRMDAMSPEAFKRWGHKLSDAQLKALVLEPCEGFRMHPVAEVGYCWLDGSLC